MTELQLNHFYLPAWTRCARANNWHNLTALRLPARDISSPLAADLALRVRAVADQIARAGHRAVRPEDLRHACHITALGRDKSSRAFTNAEADRVVFLFALLADPDSIAAVQDWENPDLARKRNLIAAAWQKAPEAYVLAILRDRFHTRIIEDLSLRQLQQLCMTLNHRNEAWRQPASGRSSLDTEPAGIDCPF